MGRLMVPRVKDNNSLGTQKRPFQMSRLVRAARGTSKFQNDHILLIVVTWLKYCRYGVKKKNLQSTNRQIKNIVKNTCKLPLDKSYATRNVYERNVYAAAIDHLLRFKFRVEIT